MYFDSLNALLYMEGHGAFVWAAYFITGAVVALLLLAPQRRQRRFLRQLSGEIRRQQGAAVAIDEEP